MDLIKANHPLLVRHVLAIALQLNLLSSAFRFSSYLFFLFLTLVTTDLPSPTSTPTPPSPPPPVEDISPIPDESTSPPHAAVGATAGEEGEEGFCVMCKKNYPRHSMLEVKGRWFCPADHKKVCNLLPDRFAHFDSLWRKSNFDENN